MQRFALALAALALVGCGSSSPTAPAPTPTPTPAPSPSPTPTPTPAVVLRRATFVSANGYVTQGGAQIVRDGSSFRLELGADFRTSNSTALDVRLCSSSRCGAGELNLGVLQSRNGASSYALPDDGAARSHVVIWCRAVNLAFGFGVLQ